ncbi:tetratricopeptide repeat-containing glycosyltransferase family 2 protein [Humisphaera borealis]|uniref:Glycosyltransferase n=1 Tax=Humisphaera borealis TaxID=2807512 RepID=A0A7M2WXJ2_9BACT|nr:TPR domain-containing glycosyltransferase [Humisphaera borealis]QOV89230.1 glycosyltransferase [Humisphaera borealis]
MRQRVSLCMIVRNEEHNLPRSLAGLAQLFDDIVIVDTGSTDGTRAVAEAIGARVYDFTWCDDFSAARNFGRRQATGDWIFWLDADDRFDAENLTRLRRLLEQLPVADELSHDLIYVMSCRSATCNPGVSFDIAHTRLFRNRSDIAWRGRIHERLVHGGSGAGLADNELVYTDVVIHHEGYRDAEQWAAKQLRDQRVLEREYLVHPDDPMTAFYLGRVFAAQRLADKAIPFLRRSIQNDPQSLYSSTPKAASILIKCLIESSRFDEAVAAADSMCQRFAHNFELLYECGAVYLLAGRAVDAENCARALLAQSPSEPTSRSSADQCRAGLAVGMDTRAARMLLAEALCAQGRPREAAGQLRTLLVQDPSNVVAWAMRGEASLCCNDLHDAELSLKSLSALPNATFQTAILRALFCSRSRQFTEALRWARKAIAARPEVPSGWITLGNALYDEGVDWRGCAAALEQALRLNPRLSQVRQQLQRVQAYITTSAQHQTASQRTSTAAGHDADTTPLAAPSGPHADHTERPWGGLA